MSRMSGCYDEIDDEDAEKFSRDVDAAYTLVTSDLRGFLAYLDGMEPKEIIADRFFMPASKRMCSVAAYCAFKGAGETELRTIERDSRVQRLEDRWNDGDGAEESWGWEGPTVASGTRYGLPEYVAYDLAFHNDEMWDKVRDEQSDPRCDARCTAPSGVRRHGSCPDNHYDLRPMTAHERWLKLRNYVARRIGETPLTSTTART